MALMLDKKMRDTLLWCFIFWIFNSPQGLLRKVWKKKKKETLCWWERPEENGKAGWSLKKSYGNSDNLAL